MSGISEWVGQRASRTEAIVTCVKKIVTCGGSKCMHWFADELGNKIGWQASETVLWLEVDSVYRVKFTVWDHRTHPEGDKYTLVNRVKVLEKLA